MSPFEPRTWQGNNLTTTWNRPGAAPRSFTVKFAIDWNNVGTNWQKGPLQNTKGTSCGQNFTVQNGRYDFTTTPNTVTFDMIFDEAHPPEVFSGVLNPTDTADGYSSISGTIKVKSTWLQGKPSTTYNLYSRYRAWVTLL